MAYTNTQNIYSMTYTPQGEPVDRRLLVKYGTEVGTFVVASAPTDNIVGVTLQLGRKGEAVPIAISGMVNVIAGDEIAYGDPVKPGVGGKVYKATSADSNIVGYAQDAYVANQLASIVLK